MSLADAGVDVATTYGLWGAALLGALGVIRAVAPAITNALLKKPSPAPTPLPPCTAHNVLVEITAQRVEILSQLKETHRLLREVRDDAVLIRAVQDEVHEVHGQVNTQGGKIDVLLDRRSS